MPGGGAVGQVSQACSGSAGVARLAELSAKARELPWFALTAIALVLARVPHLGETIDGPHSGRQCDTAFYALEFHRSGINLLRPSVCWLGAHKALALEFPLPEAIAAVLYHILGPRLLWMRLVTLGFFLGAVWYLHRLVAYLRSERTARLVTLLYLAMPLAMVYSRAVHVDFAAVFFAHGMLYYLIRGYDEERTRLIVTAGVLGALAFAIKAPYAFFLFIPVAAHVLRRVKLRLLLGWSPWLLLPLVVFLLWRHHVYRLNASAPDWSCIPGYYKYTDMGHWYYGPLAMRLEAKTWASLAFRTMNVIPGALGMFFAILGVLAPPADRRGRGFFWLWLAGAALSLLIFFKLNVIHDYYQIPFIAPVAFFVAVGLEWVFLDRPLGEGMRPLLPFAFTLLLLVAHYVRTTEGMYYEVDRETIEAGTLIRENTPRDALVIASIGGSKGSWWFDPRLLFRADRCGWSVPLPDLSEKVWKGLMPWGATHLAILSDKPIPPELIQALSVLRPPRVFELTARPWTVYLYDLTK